MIRVVLLLLGVAFVLPARAGFMPRAGLWFNPDRNGHGLDFEFSSDNLAVAWYSYRGDGTPIWYLAVAPWSGREWRAELNEYRWDGQVATPFPAGSISLYFSDQESARMDYTVGAATGSESIIFLRFGPDTAPVTDPTGLWFDVLQPGWGLSIAGQGETLAVISYFYDDQGLPSWSIASGTPGLGAPLANLALTSTGLCPGCGGTPSRDFSEAGSLTLTALADGRLKLDMDVAFANTVWQRTETTMDTLTVPVPEQPTRLASQLVESHPIDGVVDFSEFDQVESIEFNWIELGKGAMATGTLRWARLQSDSELYLALEWDDPAEDGEFDIQTQTIIRIDGVQLLMDSNGNGQLENGEDARFVVNQNQGAGYLDQHVAEAERPSDQVGNGLGRLQYDPLRHKYQAELLLPLADDLNGEDGVSGNFNLLFLDDFDPNAVTGRIANVYGDTAADWPALLAPQADVIISDRPELPADLSGTIAFISDDQGLQGEIYRFDPATGQVDQVTNLPGLFKDNVSLSNDRTRVAFHGSPDKDDFTQYEIYLLDLDSGQLTQLTTNSILDGHPAWSPDDQRIAFASFRNPVGASVIIADLTGSEIINLTPDGNDDNDPEFLPDGRLLIKTDRFTPQPNIDIAVINPDGSGLVRVTANQVVSDHDAVGDQQFTVFERFPLGTEFSTDPRALFTAWDLVQARLDGSEERLLLHDSFINWLPVYSPDGLYVAFQKSRGFTDLRLMTRAGRRLGRLLPNHSRVRYFDWK